METSDDNPGISLILCSNQEWFFSSPLPRDVCQCLDTFLIVTSGRHIFDLSLHATGIWWIKIRDSTKFAIVNRTAVHQSLLVPNVKTKSSSACTHAHFCAFLLAFASWPQTGWWISSSFKMGRWARRKGTVLAVTSLLIRKRNAFPEPWENATSMWLARMATPSGITKGQGLPWDRAHCCPRQAQDLLTSEKGLG